MPRPSLKQRADGRYQCEYKGKYFYGATQTEAYAKRDAYIEAVKAGLNARAQGLTVAQYAQEWLPTYKAGVGDKTYNYYAHLLEVLCAECGHKRLADVTPSDIQRVYNARKDRSKSDIGKLVQVVQGLFAAAYADQLINRSPCLKAKAPNGTTGTHRALEPWERDVVVRMATETDHRFAPAVLVMMYAGLRRGEALAIDIDRDVDFKAHTITVREAVRYDSNQPILSDPKTEAGKRTIPLADGVDTYLTSLHGLLAPDADGKHMSEIAFKRAFESYLIHAERLLNGGRFKRWHGRTRAEKEALEAGAKLPAWRSFSFRPHDLRHTYCTMLYEASIDLKTAQKWMGHADHQMIMRIYAHLSEQQEAAAVEKLRKAVKMPVNAII